MSLNSELNNYSTLELAQALMAKLSISSEDWHRLKSHRNAQASQLVAAAMVFLVKNEPLEAQARLNQALGRLDKSVSAPPCPSRHL